MPSPALPPPALPSPAVASPPASPAFRRWAIAVTVYVGAVFNRTSLGVAGLEAAARFRITPGQLSVFVLAQLGVYAAMQVPTGLLVDRLARAAADHGRVHHGHRAAGVRLARSYRKRCWPGASWAAGTR